MDKINRHMWFLPLTKIFTRFSRKEKPYFLMGANFEKQCLESNTRKKDNIPFRAQKNIEKYFRPSSLSILNNQVSDFTFFDPYFNKSYNEIILPISLLSSPEKTIINYFSILREAENFTKDKIGGCGTVGMARIPFPVAYNFFTKGYQKEISYQAYLKSFEGIGHTNLIKLKEIPMKEPNLFRYFFEIETIEGSSKNLTYFAYYYGFINLKKDQNIYKISNIELVGEDFLCAAYHLWQHDAEAVVDIKYGEWCKIIKNRKPTKQQGYVKTIEFTGMEGSDYRFEFIQLTNDTDILISQYKKNPNGLWQQVDIKPEDCLGK